MTLSDDEAKRRGTQKSILERKAYPAFEVIIEINEQNSWTIHEDVKHSVDLFLRGNFIIGQIRQFSLVENIKIKAKKVQNPMNLYGSTQSTRLSGLASIGTNNWISMNQIKDNKSSQLKSKQLVIYPYSLPDNLLKEVLLRIGVKFALTNEIQKANLIIGLKKHLKQNFKLTQLAKEKGIPIYFLNQISFYQIHRMINFFLTVRK